MYHENHKKATWEPLWCLQQLWTKIIVQFHQEIYTAHWTKIVWFHQKLKKESANKNISDFYILTECFPSPSFQRWYRKNWLEHLNLLKLCNTLSLCISIHKFCSRILLAEHETIKLRVPTIIQDFPFPANKKIVFQFPKTQRRAHGDSIYSSQAKFDEHEGRSTYRDCSGCAPLHLEPILEAHHYCDYFVCNVSTLATSNNQKIVHGQKNYFQNGIINSHT